MSRSVVCKDCAALDAPPAKPRPAPHPGPRCVSHWRAAVKRRKARTAENRNVSVYGLGDGDYERLYEHQGGRCALCRVATGARKRLAVDHDHQLGFARGLLCGVCNKIIGVARDNPEWFDRAAAYLRNPPASQIGIMAIHIDNREDTES